MVMSMSSLESPLEADPVILMSFCQSKWGGLGILSYKLVAPHAYAAASEAADSSLVL